MDPNATLETLGAALAVAAGLLRLLIFATTGVGPDELLVTAAAWAAAFTMAGIPVGLLLARGLRSAPAPDPDAAGPAPALDPLGHCPG